MQNLHPLGLKLSISGSESITNNRLERVMNQLYRKLLAFYEMITSTIRQWNEHNRELDRLRQVMNENEKQIKNKTNQIH